MLVPFATQETQVRLCYAINKLSLFFSTTNCKLFPASALIISLFAKRSGVASLLDYGEVRVALFQIGKQMELILCPSNTRMHLWHEVYHSAWVGGRK